MNLWEKIIFIGFGVITVSAIGQNLTDGPAVNSAYAYYEGLTSNEQHFLDVLTQTEDFQERLARGIEQKTTVISKVSDVQVTVDKGKRNSFTVKFTAENAADDMPKDFMCKMEFNFVPHNDHNGPHESEMPARHGFYLQECQSSEDTLNDAPMVFYNDGFAEVRKMIQRAIGKAMGLRI